MEQADLFHPRVFSDQEWAESYYKRNAKNIERVGKRFARILKDSGFKSGKILDAGCGFGAVAIQLAKTFPDAEIIGTDLGEPLLNLAQSLTEQAGCADQITLVKGDVKELDFETDAFDVVVNTFMAHIVDDPVAMFNEIERLATPGGKIMITDLRRIWLGLFVRKLKTAFTLEEAMTVVGKSEIRSGEYSKGPFWWDYMAGL
ncbi:class I SAM-dependent methyltransferase [Desulfonema magnum]|nr:class I SAM-dependent methyltransferase [Desulfonema magnum]